jgi:hypothetical protein
VARSQGTKIARVSTSPAILFPDDGKALSIISEGRVSQKAAEINSDPVLPLQFSAFGKQILRKLSILFRVGHSNG